MTALLLSLLLAAGPTPAAPAPAPAATAAQSKEALKRTAAVEEANLQESPEDTEALYRLGLIYLALNEPRKAVAPLRSLVKLDAGSVDATVLLARALRLSGDAQEAKTLLDGAISTSPEAVAYRAERGLLARLSNDHDAAVDHYLKAVELSPRDAEVRFNLAEALHAAGKTDDAIARYREALAIDANLTAARVNLGKALAEKLQYAEAKDLLQQAARTNLGDAEAHYNLGVILMREGNVEGAMAAYQRALAVDPAHARAHNNLGVVLDGRGDHKKAADEFRKALKSDPGFAEASFNLGLALHNLGDARGAVKAFEKALELKPRASAPYTQLGNLYLQQGKRDKAVEAFKKAIELAQDDGRSRSADAYKGLALAYLGQNKASGAVEVLQSAVKALPDDAGAHAALAAALWANGDLDGAVAEYERRAELDPSPEARLELARAYAKKRVSAKAEPVFQKLLEEDPQNRAAWTGLADLYLAMGSYDRAEKLLTEAQQKASGDPSVLARLGILQSRNEKPHLAVEPLEEATRKDPTLIEARAELGYLYARGFTSQKEAGQRTESELVDRSLKVLGSVLTAEPRNALTLNYLGFALAKKGQTAQAEEAFKQSIRFDPAFGAPHFSLGQLYESQKKTQEAIKEYQRCVELQPTHRDCAKA
ncbi:MAG TPA: tetratricopeptide repeat protein, partial [Myxococcales bacterium]|nr:tetratricopeptide repeat protein [Myxococcales bacterium]